MMGETGPSYGVGAEYYFTEHSGIRLDLTRYEFGDLDTTGLSLGYSHRF